MTDSRLDSGVEEFLLSCINSVEQLEILLLLRAREQMDVAGLVREMRTSEDSVGKRLQDLARKGLVREKSEAGVFVYLRENRFSDRVEQLAAQYPIYRVAIINLIFSQARDPLKDFSDAFRLREKD